MKWELYGGDNDARTIGIVNVQISGDNMSTICWLAAKFFSKSF